MLGAIAGDTFGAAYEGGQQKRKDFDLFDAPRFFTDDSVLTVATIRPGYSFDVTCQGSVPEALIAFLDADDFEHTIRLAISLGGDADTQAAIAGGLAEAFFGGVPGRIETEVRAVLDPDLLEVVDRFTAHRL